MPVTKSYISFEMATDPEPVDNCFALIVFLLRFVEILVHSWKGNLQIL